MEAQACRGAATTRLTVRVFPQINAWLKVNQSISARDPVAFSRRPSNFDVEGATGIALALEARCEYDGAARTVGVELKGDFKESPTIGAVLSLTRYFKRFWQATWR